MIKYFKKLYESWLDFNYLDYLNFSLSVYSKNLYFLLFSLIIPIFYIGVTFNNLIFYLALPIIIGYESYVQIKSDNYYNLKNKKFEESISLDRIKKDKLTIFKLTSLYIIKIFLTILGFIAFVIPGLYIYIKLSMARHFLLYEDYSITRSLRESWESTNGLLIYIASAYSMCLFILFFLLVPFVITVALLVQEFNFYIAFYLNLFSVIFTITLVNHTLLQIIKTKIFLDKIKN